jgi:hypothetical protein
MGINYPEEQDHTYYGYHCFSPRGVIQSAEEGEIHVRIKVLRSCGQDFI